MTDPVPRRQPELGRLAPWAVAGLIALQIVVLRHEPAIGRVDLNDNVLHLALTERVVQAVERGENPFDFWFDEVSFGYPMPRTYQSLGHWTVAALYFLLGKSVGVATLFAWTRYLLLCFLPLSFFLGARWLGLGRGAALGAAAVAPLVVSPSPYGIEYGSFLWRGSGLFTQLWAVHALALTLGWGWRALRTGRNLVVAGLATGATYLLHFIFGYMAALSLLLAALMPMAGVPRRRRLARLSVIGATALAVAAFQLVSQWQDTPWINHSRWEAAWKWDSFGARQVIAWLAQGKLLDSGRFPGVSLLMLLGALIAVAAASSSRLGRFADWQERLRLDGLRSPSSAAFVLAGGVLWLLLFCGRPAWGPALSWLGISSDVHVHRFVAGFHVFAIWLAGLGLAFLCQTAGRRGRGWLALVAVAGCLLPPVAERWRFVQENRRWGETNLAAYERERQALRELLDDAARMKGRAFAGLAASWGRKFQVGSVPFYAFIARDHLPAVSFLYHSLALTSDVMVRFNEYLPAHYRLFGIGPVVAEQTRPMPPLLAPRRQFGRFLLYEAEGGGYFDLVSVPIQIPADRSSFYAVNDAWLQSDWVAKRQHLLLRQPGDAPSGLPQLVPQAPLPPVDESACRGNVVREERDGQRYSATVDVQAPCHLLFKMTFHPGWRATVDGAARTPVWLSPGFMGLELPPGKHEVWWRYQPGGLRLALLVLSPFLAATALILERRRLPTRLVRSSERRLAATTHVVRRGARRAPTWLLAGLGLGVLVLPVAWPLCTGRMPGGHDALEYLPRQVEFDQNVRQGILVPRWAPDLAAGFGEPLFVFSPPMLHYLAEAGQLSGLPPQAALNAACILLLFVAGGGMWRLGSYLFGSRAGPLAAAAYLYAPYFHVDLFVRHARAEFAGMSFAPVAVYGLLRGAREGSVRHWALGVLGMAGVVASHLGAALLFAPVVVVLVAAMVWRGERRQWIWAAGGVAAALALSAWVWLPALLETKHASLHRLLEGYLHYGNHFVYPQQLVFSPWGYGLSLSGYKDGMSFSLGWSHLLLAFAAGWSWWRERPRQPLLTSLVLLLLALCALMTPSTLWLWDQLRWLQLLEFPWRALGPAALVVGLLVAAVAPRLALSRRPELLTACALALLVLPNWVHARPERYWDVNPALWTPQAIARRGVAVTTKNEFWPRSAQERLPYRDEPARVVAGAAQVLLEERKPTRWRLRVDATEAATLEASLFVFPGWRAELDGKALDTEAAARTGLLRVAVPAGTHTVALRFGRTWPRAAGELASGATAVGLVVLLVVRRAAKKRPLGGPPGKGEKAKGRQAKPSA